MSPHAIWNWQLMAGRSLKKKKKSDLKPYPPMPSKSSPLNCTKISIFISLFLVSIVIIFLSLPSKALNGSDSTQIYSVEVVKEFHHDPYAFTQVNPFVDFCVLISGFCGFFADLTIWVFCNCCNQVRIWFVLSLFNQKNFEFWVVEN